jgi:hypothetical protein
MYMLRMAYRKKKQQIRRNNENERFSPQQLLTLRSSFIYITLKASIVRIAKSSSINMNRLFDTDPIKLPMSNYCPPPSSPLAYLNYYYYRKERYHP